MNPIRRVVLRLTGHIDGLLLAAVLLLLATGLVVLYSASNGSMPRVTNQLVNMLVALGVM